MRARSIKPGFFKNEDLAALGPYPKLLFAGLWLLADRKGRLEDRPPRIKGELFPYESRTNVVLMLKRLEESGFILRYSVNGTKYIQILNFEKHQNPHIKESDSTIPAPCDAPTQHQTSTVQKLLTPDSLFSDSGLLTPDTPPYPPQGGNGKPTAADMSGTVLSDKADISADFFELFWERYPHKVGKALACQQWLSVVTMLNIDFVFEGLDRWEASEQWTRGIYQKPQNWLRDYAWKDQPAPARNTRAADEAEIIAELDRREKERHA
jgi:hypothetical protein